MEVYRLENSKVIVEFLDLGGCITKIVKKENGTNYVLSYYDSYQYKTNPYFLGATIGRLAGRTYPSRYYDYKRRKIELIPNEGRVHLHGGKDGFHLKSWVVSRTDRFEYTLSYSDKYSKHEKMDFQLIYKLENNNFFIIYKGKSDHPTVCNLTNHTYFNLNFDKSSSIENHLLKIDSSKIQLIDEESIPTGYYDEITSLKKNSGLNFSTIKKIKLGFELGTELSEFCSNGVDLAYVFDKDDNINVPRIHLISDNKENELKIYTNQESCVVYTLNKVFCPSIINDGNTIKKYGGITFEMQRKPNFINEDPEYLRKDYHSFIKYEIL